MKRIERIRCTARVRQLKGRLEVKLPRELIGSETYYHIREGEAEVRVSSRIADIGEFDLHFLITGFKGELHMIAMARNMKTCHMAQYKGSNGRVLEVLNDMFSEKLGVTFIA